MLDAKTLLKLPVWTKGGTRLGQVSGFDFDEGSQMIMAWRVRPVGVAARISGSDLVIGREQVIEITAERLTVDDLAASAMERVRAEALDLVADIA